jgi:hypothetical protein
MSLPNSRGVFRQDACNRIRGATGSHWNDHIDRARRIALRLCNRHCHRERGSAHRQMQKLPAWKISCCPPRSNSPGANGTTQMTFDFPGFRPPLALRLPLKSRASARPAGSSQMMLYYLIVYTEGGGQPVIPAGRRDRG